MRPNPAWQFWLMLAVSAVAAFGSIAGWRTAARVDGAVEDLGRVTPQELIDSLRIGMSREDVDLALGTTPYIAGDARELSDVLETDMGRSVYYLPDEGLAIVGYFDSDGMRVVSVTTLDVELHLSVPSSMGGSLKYNGFVTNQTTFSRLGCGQAVGGYGANFIYAAVGCGPAGVTAFWADLATINWYGPLDTDQLSPFIPEPTTDPAWDDDVTFNGFVVVDPAVGALLVRPASAPAESTFGDLLASVQFGPRIGELPIPVNE